MSDPTKEAHKLLAVLCLTRKHEGYRPCQFCRDVTGFGLLSALKAASLPPDSERVAGLMPTSHEIPHGSGDWWCRESEVRDAIAAALREPRQQEKALPGEAVDGLMAPICEALLAYGEAWAALARGGPAAECDRTAEEVLTAARRSLESVVLPVPAGEPRQTASDDAYQRGDGTLRGPVAGTSFVARRLEVLGNHHLDVDLPRLDDEPTNADVLYQAARLVADYRAPAPAALPQNLEQVLEAHICDIAYSSKRHPYGEHCVASCRCGVEYREYYAHHEQPNDQDADERADNAVKARHAAHVAGVLRAAAQR